MSEEKVEYMFGQLHDRRVEFLRDCDIGTLMDLFPTENDIKELLIEVIVEYGYDKEVNQENK